MWFAQVMRASILVDGKTSNVAAGLASRVPLVPVTAGEACRSASWPLSEGDKRTFFVELSNCRPGHTTVQEGVRL